MRQVYVHSMITHFNICSTLWLMILVIYSSVTARRLSRRSKLFIALYRYQYITETYVCYPWYEAFCCDVGLNKWFDHSTNNGQVIWSLIKDMTTLNFSLSSMKNGAHNFMNTICLTNWYWLLWSIGGVKQSTVRMYTWGRLGKEEMNQTTNSIYPIPQY